MTRLSHALSLLVLCCSFITVPGCGDGKEPEPRTGGSGGNESVQQDQPALSGVNRRKTSELIRRADDLADEGKYAEAVAVYKDALKLSPSSAAAKQGSQLKLVDPKDAAQAKKLLSAARASGRMKRLPNAYRILLEARKLDPNNIEISQDVAYALMQIRRPSDARKLCEELIVQRPEKVRAYLYAAEAAYRQGDFIGCIDYLRQVEPLMETAVKDPALLPHRIWHMHGMAAQKAHLIPEAVSALRKCVDAVPESWEYRYALGGIYLDDGQFDLSLQSLTAALKLQPNHAMTHYYIARAHHRKGDLDVAIESYKQSLRLDKNTWMADVYTARAYETLGGRDNLLKAVSYLDSALAKNEVSHEALFTMSGVWRKLNDPKQAEAWLNRFNRVDGLAKAQEEKLRGFRQALREDPHDADARLACINVFVSFSHLIDAIEETQQLLISHPDHPEGLWHMGNLLQTQKNYLEAGFEADNLIRVAPEDARGYTLAAYCALQLGKLDAAEKHARTAYDLAPLDYGAVDVLVSTLHRIDPEHPHLPLLMPTYEKMKAKAEAEMRATQEAARRRVEDLLRGK